MSKHHLQQYICKSRNGAALYRFETSIHRSAPTDNMANCSIFVLFAIFAFSMAEDNAKGQCGVTYVQPTTRTGPHHRIVGGKEAKPHSFPWMVSVQNRVQKKLNHLCGGTLIRVSDKVDASDIVVTAAHCLYGKPEQVLVGAHSISNASSTQFIPIAKSVPHSEYSSETVANDIAILKLKTPVTFSQTIQPACLPASGEQLADGAQGIVTGWGMLKEGAQTYPDKLQQAVLPVYNMDKCVGHYKEINFTLNGKIQFCAGYAQGKIDSCSEDSGGPWVMKNAQGRYVLHGVVSFGEGCARPDRPGVYDRVSAYIKWINDQVKALTSVKAK